MKTFFIGIILGFAICVGFYHILDAVPDVTVSERWVRDTTYVRLRDTVKVKGEIVYVPKPIHDTTKVVSFVPGKPVEANNSTLADTAGEIESISGSTVLYRGRDTVGVRATFLPKQNAIEFFSLWNQDSYKEITIEKKNKFGLGFYGGVGMTPKGFQPVIGVGAFYRIEFNLKDLF